MNGSIPELRGGLVLRKCNPLNARKIDLLFLSIGGNDVDGLHLGHGAGS
jgi:hypothetical protein